MVLELELNVDSGNFDISTVNALMQLYSVSYQFFSINSISHENCFNNNYLNIESGGILLRHER